MKSKTILAAIAGALGALVTLAAFAQSGDPLPTYDHPILTTGTVPVNGTNEVQAFTLSPSIGAATIKFSFYGNSQFVTLTGTETDAQISALVAPVLGAIPSVSGTANVAVVTTGTTPAVITVTYQGILGYLSLPQMTAAITSGTLSISGTTTTQGVTADGRTARLGELLIDRGTPGLYFNTSKVLLHPTWTKISP